MKTAATEVILLYGYINESTAASSVLINSMLLGRMNEYAERMKTFAHGNPLLFTPERNINLAHGSPKVHSFLDGLAKEMGVRL